MSISFTKKVNTEFLKAINDFNMLRRGEEHVSSLLIGYSGGADSSALLRLLKNYSDSRELNIKIYAVHVNHMIRGTEANSDCSFCEETARSLGVEFISKNIDVPNISVENGIGLEEAARNARYEIFSQISSEYSIPIIATAHNSSDNLETVLFNLTRGTGINGLCGIPPVRGNIIRPLIYCSKSDIMGFCEENRIPFVTDSTNSDSTYSRNYIRNVIVPHMRRLNTDAEDAVSRMCSALRKDKTLLDGIALNYSLPEKAETLADIDIAILGRVLQNAYKNAGGVEPLDYKRITEIAGLITSTADTKVSLHGKIDFVIKNGVAFFEKHKIYTSIRYKYALKPGVNPIPEDESVIFLTEGTEPSDDEKNIIKSLKNIYKLSIHNIFYFDRIKNEIFARSREDGDKIRHRNMTKSIKKLLQSSSLSIEERRTVPFIADEDGIIAVPRIAISDRATVKVYNQALNLWYFKGKKDIK